VELWFYLCSVFSIVSYFAFQIWIGLSVYVLFDFRSMVTAWIFIDWLWCWFHSSLKFPGYEFLLIGCGAPLLFSKYSRSRFNLVRSWLQSRAHFRAAPFWCRRRCPCLGLCALLPPFLFSSFRSVPAFYLPPGCPGWFSSCCSGFGSVRHQFFCSSSLLRSAVISGLLPSILVPGTPFLCEVFRLQGTRWPSLDLPLVLHRWSEVRLFSWWLVRLCAVWTSGPAGSLANQVLIASRSLVLVRFVFPAAPSPPICGHSPVHLLLFRVACCSRRGVSMFVCLLISAGDCQS
jgi:hypothetical protein